MKDFYGPTNSVFVSSPTWPVVSIGPVAQSTSDYAGLFPLPYSRVISFFSSSIRSGRQHGVADSSKFIDDNRLLASAKKPAYVEMSFSSSSRDTHAGSNKLSQEAALRSDFSYPPYGIAASLEKLRIVENVKIERVVESVLSDDLRASEALSSLYMKGISSYRLSNMLSSGCFGIEPRLVPTRWSITAADDMLAKRLMESVRQFPSVDEYAVYSSSAFHNLFVVLLMPGSWEFENFEAFGHKITAEYEPFAGRSSYADKQVGGYYASRLAVVERLFRLRRQARVAVFREISPLYSTPLGVWQVRENVRNALSRPLRRFSSLEEALSFVSSLLHRPLSGYRARSRLLAQSRLTDFFRQL